MIELFEPPVECIGHHLDNLGRNRHRYYRTRRVLNAPAFGPLTVGPGASTADYAREVIAIRRDIRGQNDHSCPGALPFDATQTLPHPVHPGRFTRE